MRPVLCAALLAGAALVGYGQESTPPVTQQPGGGTLADHSTQAASRTDPAKLAEPADGTTPPTSQKDFVIGAEDVLSILIWGDQRLAPNTFMVRPDGKISISLLGEFLAAGKTAEELGEAISDRLKSKEILKETRVNVNVVQINSRKVWINGEVNKPGAYPLIVPTRVLEALVNAGGFRDFANKKNIVIQRGAQRFKFNYKEVTAGKKLEQNILLEPGDHIIVK